MFAASGSLHESVMPLEALRLSCPAKAGHPVITENLVVTGSPAFAGDDDKEANGPTKTPSRAILQFRQLIGRNKQSALRHPAARRAPCQRAGIVQRALCVAAASRQRKPWVAFPRQKLTRIGVLCRFSRCWLDQTSNHLQKGLLLRTVSPCKEVAQLDLRHSPASWDVRLMQHEYLA
jgi:hypothetical protein